MHARRVVVIGALLVLPFLVVACWNKVPRVIPIGIQTVSGTVKPIEISAVRRGTHALVVNGETMYYLESAVVNLQRYEDREVQLEGAVELNTAPSDTPVLVVTKVIGGPSTVSRTWSIPPFGITMDTPDAWQGKIVGRTAQFTASGSQTPVLMMFLESDARLHISASGAMLRTTKETLGLHNVLRFLNADTGKERIEIDLRPQENDPSFDVLTMLFDPAGLKAMEPKAWSALSDDILHSVRFTIGTDSSPSSSSKSSGLSPLSGSGVGMPCGGPAGVLCPKGLYCAITDVQANVGRCQRYGN